MTLDALRDYTISKDYLEWCREEEMNAANSTLRQYYVDLATTKREIHEVIGDYEHIIKPIHFDVLFKNKIDSKIFLSKLDTDKLTYGSLDRLYKA